MFINLSFLYVIYIVYYFEMEYNYFKDKYLYENKFIYVILQYKGLKEVFDSDFE